MENFDKQNGPQWFVSIKEVVNRCEASLLCRIPGLLTLVCLLLMTLTVGEWHNRFINIGIAALVLWLVAALINLVKARKAPDEELKVPKWKPVMDMTEKVLFGAWIVAAVLFVLIRVF